MTDKNIILTVIIFAYNHENSIAQAIEGVLQQVTEYGYEIWICEDCSEDSTLEICRKYAEQHPDKIKLFAQPVNSFRLSGMQNHVHQAFSRIDKKYFCYLDGDDYWCDNTKIQTALDVLENNPLYTTFAHDTLLKNHQEDSETSLASTVGMQRHRFEHGVSLESLLQYGLFFHPSARIHRNIIDFSRVPDGLLVDIFILYIFLDKGPLYYHDKIMSVYNITGHGSWSKLAGKEQRKMLSNVVYNINQLLEYKYDKYFTGMVMKRKLLKPLKLFFGKSMGWKLWYCLMFRSQPTNIPVECCCLVNRSD